MDDHGFLFNAFLYLASAVILVPLAAWLGLGSVIGFLIAGVIIGPWGLGFISDVSSTLHFAEFGVVMLLFLIGLELNPRRLWRMRKPIVGMGGSQVVVSMIAFAGIATLMGMDFRTAIIASMGLALSSTAIALKTLSEENLLETPAGNSGFSILLFQDIAVIPMLAVIPLLGISEGVVGGESPLVATLKVIGAIVIIVVGGHYLTRPIFRAIANSRSREVFTAFSLMLVIGVALLMDAVNMSMALGTFLVGVLLAESEYRHQLESDIEPFKGLLLGLFFISVGMSIDFGLFLAQPILVFALVLGLVFVKGLIIYSIARVSGIAKGQRLLVAFLLSQGGEFAFVIFSVASGFSALDKETTGLLTVVVALSMATTPILFIVYKKYFASRYQDIYSDMEMSVENHGSPVVIAGFGRIGQIIARLLHANKIDTTVIDHNPEQIERVRQFGFKVFYGDITRIDLLHSAGMAEAKLFILAIDDKEVGFKSIELIKENFPNVTIISRAWDQIHVYELLDRGVELCERETFDGALRLGATALENLGMPAHRAYRATQHFRAHDKKLLNKMYEVHKDMDKIITLSNEASKEMEKLFEADENSISQNKHKEWGG